MDRTEQRFLNNFFDSAISYLEDLPAKIESGESDPQAALLQLELLIRDFSFLITDSLQGVNEESICHFMNAIGNLACLIAVSVEREEINHFCASRRGRGRPAIYIPKDQLRFLKENNFKNVEIANMLLVSPKTISRRISLFGLECVNEYSHITDDQLDTLAEDFIHDHPFSGQRSFEGYLRAHSLRIQRVRIRDSLYRVDPCGVQERRRKALHRRVYSVKMPNSLWHIDTNHKLIRWNFVIFGGIDGFSRLPVFLEVHNNNRSSTMLNCFLNGVKEYGLPSRVRCDKGRENVAVSQFMLNERGPERGSCITGRSVHNQRVERFWRDLFAGCTSLFYYIFYYLEDIEALSHTSMYDLFCLHYVFEPRIAHHIEVYPVNQL